MGKGFSQAWGQKGRRSGKFWSREGISMLLPDGEGSQGILRQTGPFVASQEIPHCKHSTSCPTLAQSYMHPAPFPCQLWCSSGSKPQQQLTSIVLPADLEAWDRDNVYVRLASLSMMGVVGWEIPCGGKLSQGIEYWLQFVSTSFLEKLFPTGPTRKRLQTSAGVACEWGWYQNCAWLGTTI